jgi:prevent-host-death family protein
MVMKTMSAAKFKEQCLAVLDQVGPEGLVITKRGKPVARLLPVGVESRRLIGCLHHKLAVHGEILSTGIAWKANAEP